MSAGFVGGGGGAAGVLVAEEGRPWKIEKRSGQLGRGRKRYRGQKSEKEEEGDEEVEESVREEERRREEGTGDEQALTLVSRSGWFGRERRSKKKKC